MNPKCVATNKFNVLIFHYSLRSFIRPRKRNKTVIGEQTTKLIMWNLQLV